MGCFLAPGQRTWSFVSFGFFAVPHRRQLPHRTIKGITDGTPFSSAHAYKTEGGGSYLRCGTAKKLKATKDQVLWPGAKKHPTIKGITNGTPFSLAHAYKAEGGGSCLRCGTAKKLKAASLQRTKSFGLELKSTPQYL